MYASDESLVMRIGLLYGYEQATNEESSLELTMNMVTACDDNPLSLIVSAGDYYRSNS